MGSKETFLDSRLIRAISKLSQEEVGKRQYYRPVYSLHKWWARRPGTLFRSIILFTAKKLGQAEDLSAPLFKFDSRGNLLGDSYYFHPNGLNKMIILDPFMGGGTTLAEANRLGAKVVGCDINPVSHWIVRETLKPIDLTKLDLYYSFLTQTAGEVINSLYKTKCSICGGENQRILYAFWIRHINCLHCGKPVYLFKRYLLNRGMKRNKKISRLNPAVVICPHCHTVTHHTGDKLCSCSNCGKKFNPNSGVFNRGKYKCPSCGNESSLIKTINEENQIKKKLIAIEYYCPTCGERLYKTPDNEDMTLIYDIEQTYERKRNELLIPQQEIPEGSSSRRWIAHGFHYYKQIFNSRQIMALNLLIESISSIGELEYRRAFMTIFSNCLEYNNMMVPYNYPHRKLHHLFNYHALPLTTMPVENNVWGVLDMGAGTFTNCFRRYRRAKEYANSPYEKFKSLKNNIRTIFPKNEKIEARFVSSFEELESTHRGALLHCGDSSHLSFIPDKSIDAVITDPPYFDNIHYSELSNFFYVWLRLLENCDHFTNSHVPAENEAIVNRGMNKTEKHYSKLLISVLSECHRTLKDNGVLVFTFHHSNPKAWWIVMHAMRCSGFFVIDYFPARSEYKVNPHVRGKKAIETDLVIFCSKSPDTNNREVVSMDAVMKSLKERFSLFGGDVESDMLHFYFVGELLRMCSHQVSEVPSEFFRSLLERIPEKSMGEEFSDLGRRSNGTEITQYTMFEYL